jgi:hypothetical protein
MHSVYLQIYIAFLILVSILILVNTLWPKKNRVYNVKKDYEPKVLVIIPCKGFDIELKENLNAIKRQTYKNYDVVAVVASKKDSAIDAIKKTSTKFVVSGDFKCKGSAKVRSLAFALSNFKNYDAYVILDSDVLVGSNWLRLLIEPLSDSKVGISTAFPIFEPVNSGFWVKVKHAWGFVGQGLMENERTAFGWGGSLAFRKNLLSKNDFDFFSRSISDDIALTKIAKSKHLRIAYVPKANPVVKSDDNFDKFVEWSNRQTAFFISGSGNIASYAIAYYTIVIVLFISAFLLGIAVSPLLFVLLLPFVAGAIKLYIKSGKKTYMLWIYFVMNFIYLYNMVIASRLRYVKWRGIVYDIRGSEGTATI